MNMYTCFCVLTSRTVQVEWNAVHAADHQDCCGMEPPCNAAVQAQSLREKVGRVLLLIFLGIFVCGEQQLVWKQGKLNAETYLRHVQISPV